MRAFVLISFFLSGLLLPAQEPPELITHSYLGAGQHRLQWQGGTPPFEIVELSTILDLNSVVAVHGPYTAQARIIDSEAEHRIFYVRSIELADETATYRLTFTATWSEETHPVNFPPSFPHFSRLIGCAHDSASSIWLPGQLASTGIKDMAELGNNTVLKNEMTSLISQSKALEIVEGTVIGSPDSMVLEFTIDQEYPQVSFVAMIAPSPDWFVGIRKRPLFVDGDWLDDRTFQLHPYDAGTDSGVSYSSGNSVTNPPQNIRKITGFPFLNNGAVAPLGTLRFERIY